MGNLSENIKGDLVQLNGKSADHVTHALKRMSGNEDGTMVDGLIKLVDAFTKDKQDSILSTKKTYGVGGIIVGTFITGALTGSVYLYNKKKKKNEQKIEKDRLEKIMHDEVILAKTEENSNVIETEEE